MTIYPNPVHDKLFVNLNSSYKGTASIKIFNTLGVLLYQDRFQKLSALHTHPVDLGTLNQGTYFIQVAEGEKTSAVEKFVKSE